MSEEGDKLTRGAVPVPLKFTVCGLVGALSVSVSVPVWLPVLVGLKVTFTTQLLPLATGVLVLQVVPPLAIANCPVTAILVKVKDDVPVLLTVTLWGELVVPTA